MKAKRLADPDAKIVLDAAADFDRRFKEQKPAAGSEAARNCQEFNPCSPDSAPFYQVKFEKGAVDYRIWLTPDGKVESANFRPAE